MKKILVIGNGGREHAIVETLKRSAHESEVYVFAASKNPGIYALSKEYFLSESLLDFEKLINFAKKVNPDFAIIGPDNPIGAGCADLLLEIGIKSVAPLKTLARLESSKGFTRELLKKYNIEGNPKFKVFTGTDFMLDWLLELKDYVVKADGLFGGKGVKVFGEHLHSHDESIEYAKECINEHGSVVIEERFIGIEFSLMHFVDGKTVVDMPVVQDHKRAFDGDVGPNTGGTGSYSDADHSMPFLSGKDVQDAHNISVKVMNALKEETGANYHGIMYGGFIVTKNGVKLIEYNARFGDLESINVLSILKTDFIEICEAIINEKLEMLNVEFDPKATVIKYIVPEGYPESAKNKGSLIKIDHSKIPFGAKLYYASVDGEFAMTGETSELMLSSARAIACIGIADSLPEAERLSEQATQSVSGPVFHRKDIGTAELIQKRVDFMNSL